MITSPPVEDVDGIVAYDMAAAFLTEDSGLQSLLVIDCPPVGFDPGNIEPAFSFLRHVLRKREGDRLAVRGFRGELSGQPIVLIVRVLG
jgi:hypothetical protein